MSRAKSIEVYGNEEPEFVPIPIKLMGDDPVTVKDLCYGPTETRLLSEIESRHKTAWLWATVYQAIGKLGVKIPLHYHAALVMIEEHGHKLDLLKQEREWEAILRGYRWQRGIFLPGEVEEDKMEVVYWSNPPEAQVTDDDPLGFTLLACDRFPVPMPIDQLGDEAQVVDVAAADDLKLQAEAMGLKPVR